MILEKNTLVGNIENSVAKHMKIYMFSRSVIIIRVILFSVILISGISPLFAQNIQSTDNKPDSNLKSAARVNPSTLAMEMSIPLASYPGRGGNSTPITLKYSSKVWDMELLQSHYERQTIYGGNNPDPRYRDLITKDIYGIFNKKSNAGWTSSLQPPAIIDLSVELYDSTGQPIKLDGDNFSVPSPETIRQVKHVRIEMPDGSSHEFRKSDDVYQCSNSPSECQESKNGTYLSIDSSRMKLVRGELQNANDAGSARDVLYLPDGGRYIFSLNWRFGDQFDIRASYLLAEKYIDASGNISTYDLTNRQWIDNLARTIKDPLPLPFGPNYAPLGTQTVPLKGLNNEDRQYQIVWKTLEEVIEKDAAGTPIAQIKNVGQDACLDVTMHPVMAPSLFTNQPGDPDTQPDGVTLNVDFVRNQRVCVNTWGSTGPFSPSVMSELVLPDGQKYKFEYDEYAEITKITYPTSGYERFEYGLTPPVGYSAPEVYSQSNRGVKKRYVSFDGVSIAQTWTYNPEGNTIAPDGTKTERSVYFAAGAFGFDPPLAGMPMEEKVYDANGQLRSRTLTEWTVTPPAGQSIPPFPQPLAFNSRDARPVRQISIIFEGGQALATMSETEYETPGENGSTAPTDPEYFARLNAKQIKNYHYLPMALSTAQSNDPYVIRNFKNLFYQSGQVASISQTDYLYSANYKARNITGLATESRSLNPANPNDVLAKSQVLYDEPGFPIISAGTSNQWQDPNTSYQGNATTSRKWLKESDTWLDTHSQFDNFGNLRKSWDVNSDSNRFTETEYSSTYQFAYPTKVTAPAPDPTDTHGTNTTSTVATTYDPTTGLPLTVTDDFGQITKTDYDSMLRPWKTYAVNYVMPEGQTIYGTPDSSGQLPAGERFIRVRKQIDANNWNEVTTWSDGLGRTIKIREKDSEGDVFVETKYDQMGRVEMVSNPYRSGETIFWKKTRYDAVGRAVETFAPSANPNSQPGASLGISSFDISTISGYTGTVITTNDASGRKSRSIANALGQLIRVDEPTALTATNGSEAADLGSLQTPLQPTVYKYDAYGKMITVQQGQQSRYFLYDSLGRMIRVRQPEQEVNPSLVKAGNPDNTQWTAGFEYDNLGNLITTIDSKGTSISNSYDKAGRVKTRTYSNEPAGITTPAVSFYYDGKGLDQAQSPNYAKGKLTKVTSTISENRYRLFDNLGRLREMEQRTPATDTETIATATPRISKYDYNFAGALEKETYPSGRIVKNNLKSDGDLLSVTSSKTGASVFIPYVSNFSYTTAGAIKSLELGNGRWETVKYNERLQVEELGLGSSATDTNFWKAAYEYGEIESNGSLNTAKNTGSVARQTINFAGLAQPFVQTYKYDALSRLKEAEETTGNNQNWIQNFDYDRYGNRTAFSQNIGGLVKNGTPATIAASNRFAAGQGFTYDQNGNVVGDVDQLSAQARAFTFNAENKQIEVKQNGATVGKYFYDGEGNRVKKVTDLETTVFVYSNDKLVAEYSTRLSDNPTVNYTTNDSLGSPRVITDQFGNVKARRDFMPFGEELYAGIGGRTGDNGQNYSSSKDDTRQKFTGYQNDKETGLDFAEARYYDSGRARFTAVDPLLASGKSANPQSFNRYAYVLNNPLGVVDPDGEKPVYVRGPVGNRKFTTDTRKVTKGSGFRRFNEGPTEVYGTYNGNKTKGNYIITADGIFSAGKAAVARESKPKSPSKSSGSPYPLVNDMARRSGALLNVMTVLVVPVSVAAVPVGAPAAVVALASATASVAGETAAATAVTAVTAAVTSMAESRPACGTGGGGGGSSGPCGGGGANSNIATAIDRLGARGINPSIGQSSIDSSHVQNLADAMTNGTFVQDTGLRNAVVQDVNGTILSGHHRMIAAEMTGFPLNIRTVDSNAIPGSWDDVPIIPGRRTP